MRPAPFADGSSPADPGRPRRRLSLAPSRREGRPRPGAAARARARRVALEALERRELLAAMPVPVLIDSQNLSNSNVAGQHESAPVVAYSPIDPDVVVSVWTAVDPTLPAPTRTVARGRISFNGGDDWSNLNATPGVLGDPTTSNPTVNFSQVTDSTVAFDRNGNIFVLQVQSNGNNAGAVVLNRYNPAGGFVGQTVVYSWNRAAAAGAKAVLKPVLAVDATTAFVDPTTGQSQSSPFQNRVYVAWAADTPVPNPDPTGGNWNPATIELLTSTDGGVSFGAPVVVNAGANNGNSGSQRNGSPSIAISQGRAGGGGPAPGQVNVVYEDYGTEAGQSPARSVIRIARSVDGGASIAGRAAIGTSDANRPVLGAAVGGSIATPGSPVNIGSAPVIASDNTLGSFSPFAGRLYVAYTGRDHRLAQNPVDNTDIFVSTSDDGITWTAPRRVNNDLAATDGFSEAAYDGQGRTVNGRPQWQPAAAVDPVTGTVLLSWFDTRHDASEARVTTYVAASSDGGADFTGQAYANRSITPIDLVTRQAVNLGPIPDNQAAAGPGVNGAVGFGHRSGLAAYGGRAFVAWASNENGGVNGVAPLDARLARVGFAAGPRVLSGTSGPVGDVAPNDEDANDGSPVLRGFDVTFDRRVAVADFNGGDVAVRWLSPDGSTFTLLNSATFAVDPLDATTINGVPFATRFRVTIPAQTAPGTYSYSVGPDIRDRIRARNGTFNSDGNAMDQDADGTNLNDGEVDNQDAFAVPGTTTGVPFAPGVLRDALPLIVPGPHVVATAVPGHPASSDNLALNGPVSALDVTFDREMDPASFTAADVLRVMGPAGDITRPSRFGSTDVGRTIADGATTTSLLVVDNQVGGFTIADLDVRLDIAHPRLADLRVELVAPDGTVVPLVAAGTAGANFAGTTFDDEAPRTLGQGTAPYGSVFRPAGSLAALDGKLLRGTWALRVTDEVAGGGTGTIAGWSLVAAPQAAFSVTPVGAPGPAGGFRTFRVGFPTQSLSGTYTVELGPQVLSRVGGHAVDSNRNAGMDALRQVPTSTQSFLYNSPQAPLPIPAGGTLVSQLTIADSFRVVDADLTLDISFANAPDLEAYLVLPDGTEVRLFRGVGTTGTRQNFSGTVFDDQAPTSIDIGGPPFSGRFRPQEPLDALNDLDSAGTYGLKIVNASATLAGNLNGWSLTLRRAVASTGLGEPVADRISANFRIFNSAPTNSLASSTWNPLGPASIDADTRAGRVGAVAVDPSDPSGNTVYIGGASGGVWKTTNFLTTDPDGPTWLPLTDFGPTFGLNVAAITVFPRNNDPNQSIVFAATGHPDGGSRGAGILRSSDGGATWTLLDSTNNNLPFAQRDRAFSGANVQAYRMVVDPRPGPTGGVIVYAAMSTGLWRSLDAGQTWTQQLAGVATDVVLDLNSGTVDAVANPSGNLQIGYAAISGQGVYRTVNKGDSWSLVNGGVGKPFTRDNDVGGAPAVPVATNPSPAALGRIALAKPALVPAIDTDSQRRNLLTQGWVYAAGVEASGNVALYQTKDGGQNWARVELNLNANSTGTLLIPTNDTTAGELAVGGANNLAIEVDPNDPNIVYIGLAGNPTLIRVDVAAVLDAHAFYLNSNLAGGATSARNAAGGVAVKAGAAWDAARFFDPRTNPYVNLLRNPDGILGEPNIFVPAQGPFDNTGYYVNSISSIANSGAGAKWTQFEGALQYLSLRSGQPAPTTGVHRMVSLRDPLTGRARLIVGDDHGLYTAVDNGRGGLLSAVGTASTPVGPRNGNLAIAQFFYGAIQPSVVTTGNTTPAALLYGSTSQNGGLQSTGDILATGNLNWAGAEANYSAGAVATDPQGTGAVFQYWFPGAGGNTTDFFQYAANGQSGLQIIGAGGAVGRTSGLINPNDPSWANTADLNFAINPLTSQQIVISSNSGRIYRTQNQGVTWFDIGPVVNGLPTSLDGSPARAIAYGAPDPAVTGSNIDDFIYAGTRNGNLWVTTNGGRTWANLNRPGLDGSPIMAIAANPARGSHEVYIATQNAVYHMPDALAPGATWRNVTGNLFALTRPVFGDPNQVETVLKPNALKALSVDWRYTLPDVRTNPDIYINPPNNPTDANATSPLIYVGGEGGVFRTVDNGATWRPFPSAEPNSLSTTPTPPGDGGGLPVADVRDLDMSLGKIDPVTGRPVPVAGDPNLLVAWTFGRGAFGIRLAPIVLPDLLALDPRSPDAAGLRDGGSDSGNDDGSAYPPGPVTFRDRVTNVVSPSIAGFSQQSAFGTTVHITLYDLADPANPRYVGGWDPSDPEGTDGFGLTDSAGRFVTRDAGGNLVPGVPLRAGLAGSGIPRLPDGLVRLGVQATDQAGVRGNMAIFEYTLDTTAAAAPAPVDLQAGSDTGWRNDDNLINRNNASAPLAPVFDVGSLATPVEPRATVLLYRAPVTNGEPGAPVLVNRLANATPNANGVLAIADINTDFVVNPATGVIGPVARGPVADGVYLYTVRQYDAAGNLSAESAGLLVTIETVAPNAPTTDLVADDDTGRPRSPDAIGRDQDNITFVARPRFQGNVEPNSLVELFVGGTAAGSVRADATGYYLIAPTIDLAQGANAITIRQTDTAGNPGPISAPLSVTLDTVAPAGIAPDLAAASDTGPSSADNYTADTTPTFAGTAEPLALVQVFIQPAGGGASLLAGEAVADASGAYAVTLGAYVLPQPAPPDGTLASLLDGDYNVTIRQLDVAGNVGATSAPLALTIDTVNPAPTVAPDLQPASDSPASGQPGFVAGVTDVDNLTNVTNPSFTVAGVEPFAVVRLFRGGAEVAAVTVPAAGGPVTITDPGPVPSAPPTNVWAYTVTQTDRAGNVSAVSGGLTVTFDTTPPVTPGAPDLQATSDSPDPTHPGFRAGVTDTDNITNVASPTFDVFNVEASATVQLLRNGAVVATLVNVGPGTVALADANAPEGTHTYTARQYDLAGNLAAVTGSLTVVVDRTVPATPGTPDLQALSDTALPGEPPHRAGVTDADNLTFDTTPTFDVANIEAGATVELLRNGAVVATLVNVGPGTVAITDPNAPEGTHAYTVRQYDLAGNLGAPSAALTVTIDTTPPATPPAPDLQALSDTALPGEPPHRAGVTDADNLTFDTTPTFDAANIEGGATLQLLRDGVVVATLVNVGPGTVAITDPAAPQGTHVYAVRQYDLAGNLGGTSAGLTVTIDTTPPATPPAPDLQALSDTALPGQPGYRAGVTDVDNLTFDNSPTFDAANLEAGATLQLLRNGVVVATLVNVGPGTVAITDPSAPDGTHAYAVRQYDLAGNLGGTSAALSVTIDTSPPVAIVAPDLQAASDTPLPGEPGYRAGITDADNVTRDLTPSFDLAATGVEATAMVQLLRKPAGAADAAYVVVAEGLGARTLTDGTVSASGGGFDYATRQVDLAGNVGPLSPPLRVVIDVAPPAPPAAPDLQADSDTGARTDDNVTRITLFRFPAFDLAGVEPTATAFLVRYDAQNARQVVNSRIGPGPLNDPVPVADGVYRYTVYQVDLAGNTGPESPALPVTIDTSSPAPPLAPDLLPTSDTGPSDTDNITSSPEPEFAVGGVEPGATVYLLRNGVVAATLTNAAPVGGVVTIRDPGPVWAASHAYTAFQVDPAGNQSPIGGGLTVVVNSDVPAPPTSPDLLASSDSGASNADDVTNVAAPEFLVGGVELTSRVELLRDGVVVASRNGPGTLRDDTAAALADGVYSYTTRQVTQAGNTSAQGAPLAVTIDRNVAAPNRPDLVATSDTGASDSDNITSDVDPTFDLSGAEPGAVVQLVRRGVVFGSTGGVPIPGTGAAATSTIVVPAGAGLLRVAALRVRLDATVGRASDLRATLIAPDGTRVPLFANVGAGAGADFVGTVLDDAAAAPIDAGAAPFTGSFRPAASLAALAGRPLSGSWALELRDTVAGGGLADRLNSWALDFDAAVERNGDGAVTDPGPLAGGVHEYVARQVDRAGNVSPYSPPLAVTIVTGTPAAPAAPDLQAASDTGPSDTDNVTSATAPVFDVAGAGVVPSYMVQLLRKMAGVPADQYAVVASRTGAGPLADPAAPAGRYDYAARQVDAAGNPGAIGPATTVTIDADAPVAPGTPDLVPESDTGNSDSDNTTSDVSPTFNVASGELGATTELLRKPAGAPAGAFVVVATRTGPGTLTDPGPLAAGSYDYAARQVDLAGNVGPIGGALRVVVDLSAPSSPSAPDLLASSDTGTNDDNVTSAPSLAFAITGVTAGNTVLLLRRDAGSGAAFVEVARGVVAAGATAITLADAPGSGRYEYRARHVTASGAATTSAGITTVAVDRSVPAVPGLTLLVADDSGRKGDRRTVVRRPRMSGVTEPGATVELLGAGGAVIATAVASAAANGAVPAGTFVIQPPAGLLNGHYSFRARARDAAGNTSAVGAALGITLTTAAGDYNGDGAADWAVYWPSRGRGLVGLPVGALGATLGGPRDIPIAGDFDGDGKVDLAVFQPAGANWRMQLSSRPANGAPVVQQFGNGAWVPLEGDYDGNGRADFAMYDPATRRFLVGYNGAPGAMVQTLGSATAIPVAADLDGDLRTDVIVYEPSTGQFSYRLATSAPNSRPVVVSTGTTNAVPVVADYDGDNKADLALYIPANGRYRIFGSSGQVVRSVAMTRDVAPLVGDFDGDGKADPGTYRQADGLWSLLPSTTGVPRLQQFGGGAMVAIPVPMSYRRPAAGGAGRVLPPPPPVATPRQAPAQAVIPPAGAIAPPAPAVPLGPLAIDRRARRPAGR